MQQFALRRKFLVATGLTSLFFAIFLYLAHPTLSTRYFGTRPFTQSNPEALQAILSEARAIVDSPPPTAAFGERGLISQKLAAWIDETSSHHTASDLEVQEALEDAVSTLYPFMVHPEHTHDTAPLTTLRKRQVPGSRGIVVPVGRGHARYAAHLIANLRDVLGSTLPIELAYAGEDDLPEGYRIALKSLGPDISFLDVLSVFDDETLDLKHGGWAIKPFAVLASRFEQTIMLDADTVFLQKPETILNDHQAYKATGALLFHDRLLWQNVFKDRTKWWHEQMSGRQPSAALNSSLVWTENYAEEGDSGVVVVNKKSTLLMLGMLHVAWQNTKAIRDEWTYKITYGDKESWWFGLELTGVPFAFEQHYGGVLGESNPQTGICGFSIAHLDERQRLLWFNGSLLKNKAVSSTEYWVPSHFMVDGVWAKGRTKADMSCMNGGEPRTVDEEAQDVLKKSVARAKELDVQLEQVMSIHR